MILFCFNNDLLPGIDISLLVFHRANESSQTIRGTTSVFEYIYQPTVQLALYVFDVFLTSQ